VNQFSSCLGQLHHDSYSKTTIVRAFVKVMFIFIAVIFIKGFLLMEDTTPFGILLLHELIVHGALFPTDLFLLAIEGEEKYFFWLLLLVLRWRGRWLRVLNCYGGGASDGRGRHHYWPGGVRASVHDCSLKVQEIGETKILILWLFCSCLFSFNLCST